MINQKSEKIQYHMYVGPKLAGYLLEIMTPLAIICLTCSLEGSQ